MKICLYGASSEVIDKRYILEAEEIGRLIARRGHTLVFGGGAEGIMGGAARGVHSLGGRLIGVAPGFFNVDGILFQECSELILTETMRERKKTMEELSDAFIVMPGGIGTFEEFFEILTLKQLGRHCKAIAVYNMCGYYNDMRRVIENAVKERFMRKECIELCSFIDNGEELIDYIEQYKGTLEDVKHPKRL